MPRIRLKKLRLDARGRLFVFVLLLGIVLIPINKAYDSALPLVCAAAEKCVISAISDAVTRCAGECDLSGIQMSESSHSEGVTGLALNTGAVNKFKNDFSDLLTEELERSAVRVPIRIGDIIGSPIASGRGPSVTVRVTGYNAAVTDISSGITTAGINQALYRMTMTVRVTGTYILPRRETREIEFETTLPLAETLVIGSVPGYYANP